MKRGLLLFISTKGDVVGLAHGSTAVDFAYRITRRWASLQGCAA